MTSSSINNSITSPKEHLGFEVGEDRKLAGWPQIIEYFRILDENSDRVQTREVGKTTEGNPFLVATISSPETLANLERYREIQAKLADPRKIKGAKEAEELIDTGKVVVMVTCSIHATEVGSTQMSLKLAHLLATSDDDNVRRILDNVIILLVPSLNPDGLYTVKEWYENTLGTPHEGVMPPQLYHKYTGHDNNRDWFMFTQVETRLALKHCINAWRPHVLHDLHQTRTNGVRMILPPFVDPVGPNVDPILQSEIAMLGSAMASEMTAQGKAGVAINLVYDAYSPSRTYQHYHGGIRLLSETASARIASPVELDPSQLKPARGEAPLQESWNHPMPWKGGTWRLHDIVEYNFAAVMACLNHVSRYRDVWLRNFHTVGSKAVSLVTNPYAYLVPQEQRDPITTGELLDVLQTADVEIHEATEPFLADGEFYPTGTRVILTKQPYGAFAQTMLEIQRYPHLRQYPGGPPKNPYDTTAHSLPLLMGTNAVEVKSAFATGLKLLQDAPYSSGGVYGAPTKAAAYLLRPDTNASVRAVNRLLEAGADIGWTREPIRDGNTYYPPGTFVIGNQGDIASLISTLADEISLRFDAIEEMPESAQYSLRTPRIGLYRSFVPATEEGWTRFVFEDYEFPYTSINDNDVREGDLNERFDVIVLPHQRVRHLNHGHNHATYPVKYSGGLGKIGQESLLSYVERGGTLVTWDGSSQYAIQHLGLPVRNIMAGVPQSDFFAPGSLLRIFLDTNHPIAYGMPDRAAAMFVGGPVFEVQGGRVIGKYPISKPLLSGLLLGGERLFGRTALATTSLGDGEVVLMGFRPHFRAQARGTYKILFNSLYYSVARK